MKNKKLLAYSVIPLCLLLIMMGVRVPNLANLNSAPKPRPRAVLEVNEKTSKDASLNEVFSVVLCSTISVPFPPKVFRVRIARVNFDLDSITLPQTGARAPPHLSC
jgi:hypothetical protein